jgi:hypothetical protein
MPAGTKNKSRHRAEATESEERDATSDLLLKHLDVILATYL